MLQAKLIIVYASTGRTASLVAKYRPAMPVLTLVVPNLRATALSWQMEGRSLARQLLCMRGSHCFCNCSAIQKAPLAAEYVWSRLVSRMAPCVPPLYMSCVLTSFMELVLKIHQDEIATLSPPLMSTP